MQFKKFAQTFVLNLQSGEEIVSVVTDFCNSKKIFAAHFLGIGAASSVCMATYDLTQKKYFDRTMRGQLEISSLLGNVALKDGKSFIHTHITVGDEDFRAFAGHLNSATVGASCEIILQKISGKIKRKYSNQTGLNLMEL